jgi:hypothetical protein
MGDSLAGRSRTFGFAADASNFDALDFLERSRDVAAEVVVDGTRRETPPSRNEEIADSGSGSTV